MFTKSSRHSVAIAYAWGGAVAAYDARLSAADVHDLERLLTELGTLGHIAASSVHAHSQVTDLSGIMNDLRRRLGGITVDAVFGASPSSREPAPAFLVPVWRFDHERDGCPASTARFCSLDMEVIATPSLDDEWGIPLPGREGLWTVEARSIGT